MKNDRAPNFHAGYNQIATIIARYRASGLGLKAFALKEGLPPGRLHYWIRNLHTGCDTPHPRVQSMFTCARAQSGSTGGLRVTPALAIPPAIQSNHPRGHPADQAGSPQIGASSRSEE